MDKRCGNCVFFEESNGLFHDGYCLILHSDWDNQKHKKVSRGDCCDYFKGIITTKNSGFKKGGQ